MDSNIIEVDGSILEGGGQILRMAVAFSAIMNKSVRISKIRMGRRKPGLAAQHLTGLELVSKMCQARLKGAQIGSTEIEFAPGRIKGGYYEADVKTAGATSLLMQVSLPFALLADNQVTLDLKGGTNAEMAPQVDYMTEVFRPSLEKFGATFNFDLHRRGYFPKGGGHITVTVHPVRQLRNISLVNLGTINKIFGWSFVAGMLPMKLAYQMSDAAKQDLHNIYKNVTIECYKESNEVARDNCQGIVLVCETSSGCVLGGSGLGSRSVSAAEAGRTAARELVTALSHGACLDEHTQDQVIIYMALASGRSSVRVGEVTMHTQTAIYIAEKFTNVKFIITPEGDSNIIECDGIGYINKNIK